MAHIRLLFPYLTVCAAYDSIQQYGGADRSAAQAATRLSAEPRVGWRLALRAIHRPHHSRHPVHGARPLNRFTRSLRTLLLGVLACCFTIGCGLYLGWFHATERALLRSFSGGLRALSPVAEMAKYAFGQCMSGVQWFLTSPLADGLTNQAMETSHALKHAIDHTLLLLYRHGPRLALPFVAHEIGFWNLPARYEQQEATLAGFCDTITGAVAHERGFWRKHLAECRGMYALPPTARS